MIVIASGNVIFTVDRTGLGNAAISVKNEVKLKAASHTAFLWGLFCH